MSKTVEIKDDLVREVMEITGAASEREAIERVVESYVAQHRKPRGRKSMFDLVGEVRLRDDYDYKAMRAGNRCDVNTFVSTTRLERRAAASRRSSPWGEGRVGSLHFHPRVVENRHQARARSQRTAAPPDERRSTPVVEAAQSAAGRAQVPPTGSARALHRRLPLRRGDADPGDRRLAACRHGRSGCGPNVLSAEPGLRGAEADELGRDAEHGSRSRSHSGASSRTEEGPLIRPLRGTFSPRGEGPLRPVVIVEDPSDHRHERGDGVHQYWRADERHGVGEVPQADRGGRLSGGARGGALARWRTARRSSTSTWTRGCSTRKRRW